MKKCQYKKKSDRKMVKQMSKCKNSIYMITSLLLISLFIPTYSNALENSRRSCNKTPRIDFDEKFLKTNQNYSNDLRHATGSPFFAQGEKIEIYGRVFDSNCVPIPDAQVFIWQNDSSGGFKTISPIASLGINPIEIPALYSTGLKNIHNITDKKLLDQNFQYTGRAVTNRDGFYNFLTIYPGHKQIAPRVNFMVHYKNDVQLLTFKTKMLFTDYRFNISDPEIEAFEQRYASLLIAPMIFSDTGKKEKKFEFNITLDGPILYRHY